MEELATVAKQSLQPLHAHRYCYRYHHDDTADFCITHRHILTSTDCNIIRKRQNYLRLIPVLRSCYFARINSCISDLHRKAGLNKAEQNRPAPSVPQQHVNVITLPVASNARARQRRRCYIQRGRTSNRCKEICNLLHAHRYCYRYQHDYRLISHNPPSHSDQYRLQHHPQAPKFACVLSPFCVPVILLASIVVSPTFTVKPALIAAESACAFSASANVNVITLPVASNARARQRRRRYIQRGRTSNRCSRNLATSTRASVPLSVST